MSKPPPGHAGETLFASEKEHSSPNGHFLGKRTAVPTSLDVKLFPAWHQLKKTGVGGGGWAGREQAHRPGFIPQDVCCLHVPCLLRHRGILHGLTPDTQTL